MHLLLISLLYVSQSLWHGTASASTSAQQQHMDDRTRGYWKELTRICPNRNFTSCHGIDRSSWTHAARTTFSPLTSNGLGQWSSITLQTYDHNGNKKTKGGDSWFLLLRDYHQRHRLPTRVFDEGNGSYTVWAYFLFPGNYSIAGWLWYSDCHGLQEPTPSEKNPGGGMDFYEQNALKQDHCYIGERIQKTSVALIPTGDPPSCMTQCKLPHSQKVSAEKGGPGLVWRMETYSHRQNHTIHLDYCCRPRLPAPSKPFSRFLFYGDSTIKNSWEILLFMARKPCKPHVWKPRMFHELFDASHACSVAPLSEVDKDLDTILRRCTGGLPWSTVPVGANSNDINQYVQSEMGKSILFNMSNFVYNDTYARNHNPPIQLPLPREFTMVYLDGWGQRQTDFVIKETFEGQLRAGDSLVINLGAHYTRAETFDDWRTLIDKLAVYLKRMMAETGAQVVFRTSYLAKEHVFRSYKHMDGYVSPAHFQTDHRRQIFDSYAEDALIPIGVHIWDVVGESAMGDYKPGDMVHTDGWTTWIQNNDMMDLFACPSS